jgi:hypothetical protein
VKLLNPTVRDPGIPVIAGWKDCLLCDGRSLLARLDISQFKLDHIGWNHTGHRLGFALRSAWGKDLTAVGLTNRAVPKCDCWRTGTFQMTLACSSGVAISEPLNLPPHCIIAPLGTE